MTPFNYSKTKVSNYVCTHTYTNYLHTHMIQVVGPARYQRVVRAELNRVRCLPNTGKSGVRKNTGFDSEGEAYEGRYGARWKEEMHKKMQGGRYSIMCVTELMDHVVCEGNLGVVREGNLLFADTPYKDNW